MGLCSELAMDSMLTVDSGRPFHFRLQPRRLFTGVLHVAVLLVGFLISDGQAAASNNSRELQLAAAFELPQLPKVPGLPSLTGPSADWRQFDSFFTFVVKRFGDDVPANLKDPWVMLF